MTRQVVGYQADATGGPLRRQVFERRDLRPDDVAVNITLPPRSGELPVVCGQ